MAGGLRRCVSKDWAGAGSETQGRGLGPVLEDPQGRAGRRDDSGLDPLLAVRRVVLTETVNSGIIRLLFSKDCLGVCSLSEHWSAPELIVSEQPLILLKTVVSSVF